MIRPRVFWDNGRGGTLFVTVGAGVENRDGGTIDGAVLPATGETYFEALETRRVDTGWWASSGQQSGGRIREVRRGAPVA